MSLSLRRTLVTLILILYGSVSLCGSGLHALGESSGSHTPSHQHDSQAEPLVRAEPSHCPLCEFQAQGQLAIGPVCIVSRPFTSPHVVLIVAAAATRDPHLPCSPRAPPALAVTARATA
jgi:hypothetical protein